MGKVPNSMLIDHAPSQKSFTNRSRRAKRRVLLIIFLFTVALLLLSISCLNLNLFRSSHPESAETKPPASTAQNPDNSPVAEADKTSVPILNKKTFSVSSGDTLMELLVKEGLDRKTAHRAITVLKDVFNPRQLHKGHEITLAFQTASGNDPLFYSLNLKLDVTREVRVVNYPDKGFVSEEILHELNAKPFRVKAEISSSLYQAAVEKGMPIEVLIKMIRAYSYDVDFQRDIRPGDAFEALYEKLLDENGNCVRGGSILYASLKTNGRILPIYRYKTSDGEIDLFDENGKSVRKTLMVTPIDGARLSSGFGMRRHPVLGYSRMHKGLDFAAPTGTPIMAAGDGTIEYVGRKGSYGKYIRIRHANEYKTVYGHMSRYASGMSKGVRVKQGQIIGYVGSTGVSTGPHLHYEVLHRGNNLNPSSVKAPPGKTLKGEELEKFYMAKRDLENQYAFNKKQAEAFHPVK